MQSNAPEGLALIYTAANTVEAEMLRQILNEAGFHAEFVPSSFMGIFGAGGNSDIYVAADEAEAAGKFLKEYLESGNNA